jgi:hypothetical protein
MSRTGPSHRSPGSVPLALALCGVMLLSGIGLLNSPEPTAISPTTSLAGGPTITIHHTQGPTVYLTGSGFQANGGVKILVYNATVPTFDLKFESATTNASGEFNSSGNPAYMSTLGNGTYTFRANDSATPQDVAFASIVWSNGTYHLTLSANVALPGAHLNASGYGFSGVTGRTTLYLGNLTTYLIVNSSVTVLSNGSFTGANFTIPAAAADGQYGAILEDPYGNIAFALVQVENASSDVNVTFVTVPGVCDIQFGTTAGIPRSYANNTWTGPISPGEYSIASAGCAGEVFAEWTWSGPTGSVADPLAASTTLDATSNGTLTATFSTAPVEYSVTFAATPTSCSLTFNGSTYANGQSDSVIAGTYPIVALTCPGATFSSWSSTVGAVTAPSTASTEVTVDSDGALMATYSTKPASYLVSFNESGLPAGTDWSILVDSTIYSSSSTSVSFSSTNMAYDAGIPAIVAYNAVYVPTPTQSPNYIYEGPGDCPGLPVSNSFCGELIVAGDSLFIQVNFTAIWHINWVPARDSYGFTNPVDAYSYGNCYGVSQTEVLYWLHDIAGMTSAPYLPLQSTAASNTSELKWDQSNLNNASLAITVHQVLDPDNHGLVVAMQSASFNQATQFSQLEFDVETGLTPTVIGMGEPHASGTAQAGYHAVVVYGLVQFLNGTFELNISDPNNPGVAEHGWYTPSTADFYYYGYAPFRQFVVSNLHALDSSYLDGKTLVENYDSHAFPDFFVLSDGPVTLATIPAMPHGLVLEDSFGDNGGGNSQTFDEEIPHTSGIEEGAIEAYGLPQGTWFTVDPPVAKSDVLVVRSINASGTNVRYGMGVGTEMPGGGNYNMTPNSDGFNLTSTASLTLKNVSFDYRNGSSEGILNAYNLSFPAGDTERFTVDAWAELNSTTTPSVTAAVFPAGSSTASATYQLVNGENGLPLVAPIASPASTPSPILYEGLAALIVIVVAVAVIVVYRHRGKKGVA